MCTDAWCASGACASLHLTVRVDLCSPNRAGIVRRCARTAWRASGACAFLRTMRASCARWTTRARPLRERMPSCLQVQPVALCIQLRALEWLGTMWLVRSPSFEALGRRGRGGTRVVGRGTRVVGRGVKHCLCALLCLAGQMVLHRCLWPKYWVCSVFCATATWRARWQRVDAA